MIKVLSLVVCGLVWVGVLLGVPTAAYALPHVMPVLATGSLFSFSGKRPTELGVQAGELADCPSSPNCVSSQSHDLSHLVDPIPYTGDPAVAIAQLQAVIEKLPRTEIMEATDTYLYAEFTSALMGFVDDVEFYVDAANGVIQVRSASRLGESDLGVNRKRIETIRQKLALNSIG